jgi:hypothetical protein
LGDFPAKMGRKMHDGEKIFAERDEKMVCPLYKLTKTVYNDILNIPITKELVAAKRQEVTEIYGSHP